MIECIRSRRKADTKMKRYPLTKEYVKELRENPNVEKATEWTVRFTPEFKQRAYSEYYRGKSTKEIFAEAGLDVEKLGEKRLQNFRMCLMEKAEKGNGFSDKRTEREGRAAQSTEAQMLKKIRELEHRNAYLEQENDFLKKIQELEKGYNGKAAKRK